jgi:alkylation response protein AidB-like acyl-CoA dehydrogenase
VDLSYTPEQEAFRTQVRSWLRTNVPNPPLPSAGTPEGFALHREWERKLAATGYAAQDDKIAQAIFEEEYLLARGPERVTVVGTKLMAPTLIAHGTQEQKQRWLPRIASAADIWSQGFSEPGAGSDLAGIRTKAELKDDTYVINGQKIWTSYGAFADWVFVLARTDPSSQRHSGISFIAVDMATEGVEARPITQLDGHAGFAEVFFTDARVPGSNVVGDVGDGWRVAMTTLGAEREAPARPAARYFRDLRELVRLLGPATQDRTVQDELAKLYVEAKCYEHSTRRTLSRLVAGQEIGLDASTTKLQWSELERRLFETAHELLGQRSASAGDEWWSKYWYARAATIYAGTTEIQRNIIAERILGLPREPRPA